MGAEDFAYNAEHRVVVCRRCATCLVPGGADAWSKPWETHLRNEPHRLKGAELKTTIDLLSSFHLEDADGLRRRRPSRRRPCRRIEGLAVYTGYICECDPDECDQATRRLRFMENHMPQHGRKASEHRQDGSSRLWRAVVLQTYSTAKARIDYFVVEPEPRAEGPDPSQSLSVTEPSDQEKELLARLSERVDKTAREIEWKAAIVEGSRQDRLSVERWLIHTGFPMHLHGLLDVEISSSFRLPKSPRKVTRIKPPPDLAEVVDEGDGERDLLRILAAAEALFRDGYRLVSDQSLERKMTHQRAQVLSNFAAGVGKKGRDIAFRCFKNESTLTTYFRKMKELLVYYYKVVYQENGHFTQIEEEGQGGVKPEEEITLPQHVIRSTNRQRRAMDDMFAILRKLGPGTAAKSEAEERSEHEALKPALREFYMHLICHTVGGQPFQSPVLSFCAMLSRTSVNHGSKSRVWEKERAKGTGDDSKDEAMRRQKVLRSWHDPGNYSGSLSALVWMAQLIIFEAACHHDGHGDETMLEKLETICGEFMHQKGETTFGYILQWRLYVTTVARSAITRRQARWSLDGREITYLGTTVRIMQHIPQLILSEYKRARKILLESLLFGARDISTIEAYRVSDDLDADEYGGSWTTDPMNAKLLHGTKKALLHQISQRRDLRSVFFIECKDESGRVSTKLCTRATAIYEASVQEFLKSLAPLMHISPMPPLRAHEFLSMTHTNTGNRRRGLLTWERMLMLHIRYTKSREQTDKDGDNIRFIPPAIAELILTFQAVVQPLRLLFLQEDRPGASLSPYLFSKIEGTLWPDEMLSKCLSLACARAEVPDIKVAWWRQAAASITKEKFTPNERANFNLQQIDAPEAIEEEGLIVDLAEASNHSYRTFNHAYAGSTTLAMNTVLHRAFRASESWRGLWGIDELLAGEKAKRSSWRRQTGSTVEDVPDPLRAYKKARFRRRPTQDERGLEEVARTLYNDPNLKLRRPGQRDAMLAAMGPGPAEQVVAVLATGSGKSLIFMVAAALEGAGTTVVIVPTVALRGNMLMKLAKVGIRTMVWAPGETRSAPLVLVSAEAACKTSFLEYAHGLNMKQKLDCIVMDESHLTVTASFRKSMREVGSYVRQIRTQTIWLTATLPPDLEPVFIERNMLVRPCIVRESTNRRNIRYRVHRYTGPGGLCEKTVQLTIELMEELAAALHCGTYTGDHDSMSEEERDEAIKLWLGPTGSPIIIATSALGVGFDYSHVRWVIHAGAPRRMTDYSQESGRAGRDGEPAESVVLLSANWQPYGKGGGYPADTDEEFMQLYLTQKHCSRAVMSQYLDVRSDWRWCMRGEDELCGVCPRHHTEKRPASLELTPAPPPGQESGSKAETKPKVVTMAYTGPEAVLRQRMLDEQILDRLRVDLETMSGSCLLCKVKGKGSFDHRADKCSQRSSWQNAKKRTIQTCKKDGRQWMAPYTACFLCYLPQTMCSRADPEAGSTGCQFPDMILPLCYGAFFATGPRALLSRHARRFRDEADFMLWLGESTMVGGALYIQAVRVAALLLAELG